MRASLDARFVACAQAHRERVAVIDGTRALTYGALDNRSSQLAATLAARGAVPGARVGVCLERSIELIVAILGVLKAGCAYVPLDPQYPRARLEFMVADSGLAILIGNGDVELASDVHWVEVADGGGPVRSLPPNPAGPRGDAYVIYTSGSTGTPKGVCVTHANVLSLLDAVQPLFDFESNDRWTWFHSSCFDFSVWEIWGALLRGGGLVVVPQDAAASPDTLLDLIREHDVTVLNQVPSVFTYLVDEYERQGGALPLRYVIFGGERVSFGPVRRWLGLPAPHQPTFFNMYGITETTIHVTRKRLAWQDVQDDDAASPIGRPLPHLHVALVDDELEPVATGEAGEIFVTGGGVARGYLNRPDLTAERFVRLPDAHDVGYRSGDRARVRPDGELEFLGRADDQVKIRGYRIELGEVEAALRRHEQIAEAAVVSATNARGERGIVAYYTLRRNDSGSLGSSELRRHLARTLPTYMIPSGLHEVERLPVTPSGKVNRRQLEAVSYARAAPASTGSG